MQILLIHSRFSPYMVSLPSERMLVLSNIHSLEIVSFAKHSQVSATKSKASQNFTVILPLSTTFVSLHQNLRLPRQRSERTQKLLPSSELEIPCMPIETSNLSRYSKSKHSFHVLRRRKPTLSTPFFHTFFPAF